MGDAFPKVRPSRPRGVHRQGGRCRQNCRHRRYYRPKQGCSRWSNIWCGPSGPQIHRTPLDQLRIKIQRGTTTKAVRIAWESEKVADKWAATSWARRIEKREKRASLTDLERFKVGKAKGARNKMVRKAFFSLLKKGSKSYENTKKRVVKLRSKAKAGKAEKKAA